MMHQILLLVSSVLQVLIIASVSLCASGDTIRVRTHDKTLVVTDPSKGEKSFIGSSEFPPESVSYRKAWLLVTYQCPETLKCGEWDYIDKIILARAGGKTFDFEIARMISPYGSRFGKDWKFTWRADITDFAPLLHDSVEICFIHTGYESDKDRGWLVTLDFELIEGPAPAKFCGIQKLWTGSFPYGDTLKSIEEYLPPVTLDVPEGASFARLRILQTGHGMDDLENCAEFCSKTRELLHNGSCIDRKAIWKECGDNPLYPQAGTWIFDRAGWCPGQIVEPDYYDIALTGDIPAVLDINMEPYLNNSKPSASYYFGSFAVFYSLPAAVNDVSVEEILVPSDSDERSRTNPACTGPAVRIMNNGRAQLNSAKFRYGFKGQETIEYDWAGSLAFGKSAIVELPPVTKPLSSATEFRVEILEPNGADDEYSNDNSAASVAYPVPRYESVIIHFKPNKDSGSVSYVVNDSEGRTVRSFSPLTSEIFRDTLSLAPGCYRLAVSDTAGDGLDFWFNPGAGYGFIRLTDMNGKLLKAFDSDFGSGVTHEFVVTENSGDVTYSDEVPVVAVFPPRNKGRFDVEIFFNEPEDMKISVRTERGEQVYAERLAAFKEGSVSVDINYLDDGVYYVRVESKKKTIEKRIRIKRD